MAFWQFTGVSPEFFPTLGFTAQPSEVYDLGSDAPPYSQLAAGSAASGLPVLRWTTSAGPATRRIISRTSEEPVSGGGGAVSSVFTRTGAVVAAANDYTADQIADGSTNRLYTATEKTKLASLAATDTSTLPQFSGTAAAGASTSPAPRDHVHPRSYWTPEDHGLISWAFDPAVMGGAAIPAAGTLFMVRLLIPKATTITNVHLYVTTAGATLTANQCLAGLFRGSDRVLLSGTADQATNWQSTGLKTIALSSAQAVSAGFVYVGFYWNGTTGPTLARGVATPLSALINLGVVRFGQADTGLTTALPATAAAPSAQGGSFWVGVS